MKMTDVSVVIPVFNGASFVGEAVESVLGQTLRVREVIVVDDGSTDGTLRVLEAFGKRIKVLQQENLGPSSARNRGVKEAAGSLIAFLDADDLWLPTKIQTQTQALSEHPHAAFVCSDWYSGTTGTEERLSVLASYDVSSREPSFDLLLEENYVNTSTVLVEKSRVVAAGCFDENLRAAEDKYLWLSLLRCRNVVLCREVLAFRRFHSTNVTGQPDIVSSQLAMCRALLAWPEVQRHARRRRIVQRRLNQVGHVAARRLADEGLYGRAAVHFARLVPGSAEPIHTISRACGYAALWLWAGARRRRA